MLSCVATRDSGFTCGYAETTRTNFNKEREQTNAFMDAFKGKPCIAGPVLARSAHFNSLSLKNKATIGHIRDSTFTATASQLPQLLFPGAPNFVNMAQVITNSGHDDMISSTTTGAAWRLALQTAP
ncbi:hypothetical protein V502_05637 [Pseudogymnoascus sp. VKM F-4520 (FW-2644)]|nr:hypothetical protein V502_05637 [Pseudogymnoascus sp. VKM F-4520 (FW-2644)]